MRRLAVSALAAADVAALVVLRPDAGALARLLGAPGAEIGADPDGALGRLAGAAIWCVALWLGVGLLAAVASAVPGTLGRLADRTCRVLLPRAVRGALVGSAGLGVLLAPVAALAQDRPAPPAAVAVVPAPAWPISTGPRAPSGPATPSAAAPTAAPATVRVQRGDCLWLIAGRRLGPDAGAGEIAAEWPRWYAANQSVIGPDPDQIRPGQVLHEPPPAHRSAAEEAAT